jgi:dihydroorotate dehydrogenase electron transfer subunit
MPSDVVGRVLENEPLGGGYFLTAFDAPAIGPVCEPGQFVMSGATDPSELLLRRPFSVCLVGDGPSGKRSRISLLYRAVGRGTGFLSRLQPGDEAALLGPLGTGFSLPREGETPVVVAGGVGIAAFPFFLERLDAAGRRPHLLYGGRTARDLPMLDWLMTRARSVTVTTDDGSAGAKGLVTAALEARLADPMAARDRLYVCGPHPMMKAVAAIAARAGVACEVALETPMACGYGVCVGCVVEVHDFQGEYGRYRRVCVDGPVMDAREIRW